MVININVVFLFLTINWVMGDRPLQKGPNNTTGNHSNRTQIQSLFEHTSDEGVTGIPHVNVTTDPNSSSIGPTSNGTVTDNPDKEFIVKLVKCKTMKMDDPTTQPRYNTEVRKVFDAMEKIESPHFLYYAMLADPRHTKALLEVYLNKEAESDHMETTKEILSGFGAPDGIRTELKCEYGMTLLQIAGSSFRSFMDTSVTHLSFTLEDVEPLTTALTEKFSGVEWSLFQNKFAETNYELFVNSDDEQQFKTQLTGYKAVEGLVHEQSIHRG